MGAGSMHRDSGAGSMHEGQSAGSLHEGRGAGLHVRDSVAVCIHIGTVVLARCLMSCFNFFPHSTILFIPHIVFLCYVILCIWATTCSSTSTPALPSKLCRALQLPLSPHMFFRDVLTRLAEIRVRREG